jgi:predicted anti-sigma-YlaC factor YlaD
MRIRDERNCQHLLAHLSDFVDGDATAAICAVIKEHLKACQDCQVVVDTLRHTVELYHTLPQPDLPEAVRERMYTALDLKPFFTAKKD